MNGGVIKGSNYKETEGQERSGTSFFVFFFE
jgi:hypothetical protein